MTIKSLPGYDTVSFLATQAEERKAEAKVSGDDVSYAFWGIKAETYRKVLGIMRKEAFK